MESDYILHIGSECACPDDDIHLFSLYKFNATDWTLVSETF